MGDNIKVVKLLNHCTPIAMRKIMMSEMINGEHKEVSADKITSNGFYAWASTKTELLRSETYTLEGRIEVLNRMIAEGSLIYYDNPIELPLEVIERYENGTN